MFEKLTERLGDVFGRLTRRGALTEADVDAALREVRVALLEADVALPVVRDFLASVREKAIGESVLKSITPGQMVVKIVHDALVEALGGASVGIDLNAPAPVVVMMVGLQGSGKTTTTAKIALRLQDPRAQARADGLARYPPAGGAGAARRARPPGRGARPSPSSRASRRSPSPSARSRPAVSKAMTWSSSIPPAACMWTRS